MIAGKLVLPLSGLALVTTLLLIAGCGRKDPPPPPSIESQLPGTISAPVIATANTSNDATPAAAAPAGQTAPLTATPTATEPSTVSQPATTWTLASVHARASAESPQLAAAQQRIAAAMARVRQARGSYVPSLRFSASSDRGEARLNGNRQTDFAPSNESNVSLNASWLIFDGFQREFSIDAQLYDRDATTYDRDEVQRQLLRAVTATYSDILQAQSIVAVSEHDLQLNEDILRTMTDRRALGLVSQADVDNFQVRVNNARLAILVAQRDLQVAQTVLGELVGDPKAFADSSARFQALEQPPQLGQLAAIQQLALRELPTLAQLDANIRAAEARRSASQSRWSPRLFANADAGMDSPHLFPEDRRTESYSFGLSLDWNLLDTSNRPAVTAETVAEIGRLEEERDRQRLAAQSTVEQSWHRLKHGLQQSQLLSDNVRLSESIYYSTVESYELGRASITRVNQVLSDWLQAQRFATLNQIDIARQYHLLHADTGFAPEFAMLFVPAPEGEGNGQRAIPQWFRAP